MELVYVNSLSKKTNIFSKIKSKNRVFTCV